ncbi:MAG: NrsF family protein [Bdellovibrionales bacterium]
MKTGDLITALSNEATRKPLRSPLHYATRLVLVVIVYGIAMVAFSGLRPDLPAPFLRPLFTAEVGLLLILALSSLTAAVHSMYPDAYQRPSLLRLPFIVLAAFALFMVAQLFMPIDPRMVIPDASKVNGMECTLSIAGFSILPSLIIFALLRKGSSVKPLYAGAFATLAAAAAGCLMLRMIEPNDVISHLMLWHYLPTLAFAACGAAVANWLLRW